MYGPCLSKPVISHIEEEAMSLFDMLLFLIALFSVAVVDSAHLCIICRHFCCPMLLFQAHVTCRNLSLTWPHLSIPMKVSSCMIVSCVLHFSSE